MIQVHRKEADGKVQSFVRQFQKHCLTVGESDTDLPLCDANGTTKHLLFYQGSAGELRVLGAKTSYALSMDTFLMDDRKVQTGEIIELGGVAIQVLRFEPDHGMLDTQPAAESTYSPVTFLGARRRILPQAGLAPRREPTKTVSPVAAVTAATASLPGKLERLSRRILPRLQSVK